MAHYLITGGSGLVGSALTEHLLSAGNTVSWLSRNPHNTPVPSFEWDPSTEYLDLNSFDGVDYIIHLAGASIADKRWTPSYKRALYSSRVDATNLLSRSLLQSNHKPKAVICASAVGYYGTDSTETTLTEESAPGSDFLSLLAIDWEEAIDSIRKQKIRTVTLRLGVVLSKNGGALPQISKPISFGLGAIIGKGSQYMPWIHIADLVSLITFCSENPNLSGTYNAVAPDLITNRTLTHTLARLLHRPIILPPVPSLLLYILLGEKAQIITEGSKVSSKKLADAGFTFSFPRLEYALKNLL